MLGQEGAASGEHSWRGHGPQPQQCRCKPNFIVFFIFIFTFYSYRLIPKTWKIYYSIKSGWNGKNSDPKNPKNYDASWRWGQWRGQRCVVWEVTWGPCSLSLLAEGRWCRKCTEQAISRALLWQAGRGNPGKSTENHSTKSILWRVGGRMEGRILITVPVLFFIMGTSFFFNTIYWHTLII